MFLSKQDGPWNNIGVERTQEHTGLTQLWTQKMLQSFNPEILTHVWKIAEIMNHFIMIVSTPRDSHEMNKALYNFVWSK